MILIVRQTSSLGGRAGLALTFLKGLTRTRVKPFSNSCHFDSVFLYPKQFSSEKSKKIKINLVENEYKIEWTDFFL